MHIGIDVDGVLRELLEGIHKHYAEKYPGRAKYLIDPEDVDTWGIEKMATDKKVGEHMADISLHDPEFSFRCFYKCPAIDGEVEAMNRMYDDLSQKGHVISICTSQGENPRRVATAMWLMDHGVKYDNLIMSDSSKGDFDLDVLFDDRAKNCVAVEQNGGVGVIRSQPYNEKRRSEVTAAVGSISDLHELVLKI